MKDDLEIINALEDLVLATRILVNEGVIDGFGHVSIRHPKISERYFMLKDNLIGSFEEAEFVELNSDSALVSPCNSKPSIERFIHGEVYEARPDVKAIVHTHSPALIPFGVSAQQLKPLYHMCGFLEAGVPIFDIAEEFGETDMLITTKQKGQSLARSLKNTALVLMRGHGATVVGSTIKEVVFRTVYATINAQLQPIAMQMGDVKYLSPEEAKLADDLHKHVLDRPWNYWKKKLLAKSTKVHGKD